MADYGVDFLGGLLGKDPLNQGTQLPYQFGTNSSTYNPNVKTGNLTGLDKFNIGLGTIGTLGGLKLGRDQLKLGKQNLAQQISAFNANYGAQKQLSNAQMYDLNVRRNLEMGKSLPEAQTAAQEYVDVRGIQALS